MYNANKYPNNIPTEIRNLFFGGLLYVIQLLVYFFVIIPYWLGILIFPSFCFKYYLNMSWAGIIFGPYFYNIYHFFIWINIAATHIGIWEFFPFFKPHDGFKQICYATIWLGRTFASISSFFILLNLILKYHYLISFPKYVKPFGAHSKL